MSNFDITTDIQVSRRAALLSLRVKLDTLFQDYRLGYCADDNFQLFEEKAHAMWQDREETEAMGKEAERFVMEMHDNRRERQQNLWQS